LFPLCDKCEQKRERKFAQKILRRIFAVRFLKLI